MTDNTVSPYTVPLGWLPADDHAVVVDALDVVWVRQSDGMWRHGPSGTVYTIDDLWEETDRHPFTRLLTEAEWETKQGRAELPIQPTDEMVKVYGDAWEKSRQQIGRGIASTGQKTRAGLTAVFNLLASNPEGSKP